MKNLVVRIFVVHIDDAMETQNDFEEGLDLFNFFDDFNYICSQTFNLLNFAINKLQINRFFGILFICNKTLAY